MNNPIYLDTNFFVYLYSQNEETAKNIISYIERNSCYTSCLTYDEFIWIMRKLFGKEIAVKSSEFILNINIDFITIDKTLLFKTSELLNFFDLKPRDCIHYACMEKNNIKRIVTNDKDFEKLKGIETTTFEDFIKEILK